MEPISEFFGRMREKCVGCGVCAAICPAGAVQMRLDREGYFSVRVRDGCVSCGKCVRVCPAGDFAGDYSEPQDARSVLLGYHKDDGVRFAASSGGIAPAIAESALEQGYAVLGATYDTADDTVKHIVIQEKKDIEKITGSKYLPSNPVSAFRQLADLSKAVVFGTPCQIKALREAFPEKDLLLVDFRCFGPVSYHLWAKYLNYIRGINNSGIERINSRSKFKGWLLWGVEIHFRDGGVYRKNKLKDPFGQCFSGMECGVREKCLNCIELKKHSYADIRMEDAWGLLKYVSGKGIKLGASQITIYTDKGEAFWNTVADKVEAKAVDLSYAEHYDQYQKRYFNTELYEQLVFSDTPIETIIQSYRQRQSLPRKCYDSVCNLLLYSRFLYLQAKNLARLIRKLKSEKKGQH